MKKVRNASWLLALSCIFIVQGCSKNDLNPANPLNNADQAAAQISGNWVISSFVQRTEDKTSSFDGYVFSFFTGGSLEATKDGLVSTGTWKFTPSAVGYYGSTSSRASFTISLGTGKPLDRLTRTWNIDSVNTSLTKLALINPEPLEQEHLDFSKQ